MDDTVSHTKPRRASARSSFQRGPRSFLVFRILGIGIALLVLCICLLLWPRKYTIQGSSMEPTLHAGDQIRYSRFMAPAYGELVVFTPDGGHYGMLVKRVIGLAGDRIWVEADGSVYRNGKLLREPYLAPDTLDGSAMAEVTVEWGKLFVMGDNRHASIDSRDARIGQIPEEKVYGCVTQFIQAITDTPQDDE